MATQQQLDEAEAALHALMIGQSAQSISSSSGKSVTYTAANITQLRTYIAQLRRELGLPSGLSRPLGFQIG